MMHGHEEPDLAIVAVKPANKAERSAAELVERRAGTEGNADQLSTCRTQRQISVTHSVGSHTATCCRYYPRWEPYAGKPHVRICAGGREVTRVPTAKREHQAPRVHHAAWQHSSCVATVRQLPAQPKTVTEKEEKSAALLRRNRSGLEARASDSCQARTKPMRVYLFTVGAIDQILWTPPQPIVR
jgi:hypothetical protein